ncbi:MAG TPA: DUF559 domain-containing protein, partial [Phenylobacterium sp.]
MREKVSAKPTDEGSKAAKDLHMRKATAKQARALRRTQPLTERTLWKLLRDRRLDDLKFRRQVPLGPYVVDFACLSRRLIVEADGPFHDPIADRVRAAWLTGFRVLRFTNAAVAAEDNVLGHVLEAASAPLFRRPVDPSSDLLRRPPSPAR